MNHQPQHGQFEKCLLNKGSARAFWKFAEAIRLLSDTRGFFGNKNDKYGCDGPAEDFRRDSGPMKMWTHCRNNARVRSYYVWQTSGLENTQVIGIFICPNTISILHHLSPCVSHPVSVDIQTSSAHYPPSKRVIGCGKIIHFILRKVHRFLKIFFFSPQWVISSCVRHGDPLVESTALWPWRKKWGAGLKQETSAVAFRVMIGMRPYKCS